MNLLELLEDVFHDCEKDDKQDCKPDSSAGDEMNDSDRSLKCDSNRKDEPESIPKESKTREPDTSRLKYLLLALIENGQRHDYHEHGPPRYGVHACARKGKNSDGKEYVYCRFNICFHARCVPFMAR